MANLANWIEEDLGPAINDAARDHLRLLRNRAGRMEALINGILEYSRAGRGQARANDIVDLHEVVAEILELLAPPPERITVNIEGRLPVLRAPRISLERVWTNLLSNAIKYSPPQGAKISIATRERGNFWEFVVSDNGRGLAEKNHRRVFNLFQRVETGDGSDGTGIGLAVVKKLVEGGGGRVWVESELGAGSRFCFTWPRESTREKGSHDHAREA
jgi:signal transduction histidine kinase